ncbi:MAG: flagellin [Paracoccus sp. (in: a-proteobacteria)]|uniref:flagellar hook protein n=1 Tax=Paracoccus sp. TaxID=267 RepID=UPI0039E5110D
MTRFNSVSDLARSYQLRLSQGGLKAKLDTLTKETTTGVKADIPLALKGDLVRINQIESRLSLLGTYKTNLAEAESVFAAMQSSTQEILMQANTLGTVLVSDALTSGDNTLSVHLDRAPSELRNVIGALNVSVAGRSVFSGQRYEQPAVASYDDLMSQLDAAVGGATDAATIVAAIEGYFAAPAGGGGFLDQGYLGSTAGMTGYAASSGKTISTALTAASPEFRDALKGFAILAYAASASGLDSQTTRTLAQSAGQVLVGAKDRLSSAMSQIGISEEATARALTVNQAESSALTVARNGLIEADPYETAAALKEIEANIETLYTLTARLSKLSLTEYL